MKRKTKKVTLAHRYNISGLYAITPDEADTQILCAIVEAALLGHASLVQYRNKTADQNLRLQQATALLALCRSYGVPLIINDHLDLCAQIDADGLHLGATDCDLGATRRLLGADKIIGASCYNRLDLALNATAQGASYVAFGACFLSASKPNAVSAPLDLFTQAKKQITTPLVGIGGITLNNASQVIDAGADAIAVIDGLFSFGIVNRDEITKTGQQFTSLIKTPT
ncbi:MAG: thiamine phosphate synthase [Methylophilaceae bacterium]